MENVFILCHKFHVDDYSSAHVRREELGETSARIPWFGDDAAAAAHCRQRRKTYCRRKGLTNVHFSQKVTESQSLTLVSCCPTYFLDTKQLVLKVFLEHVVKPDL